LSDLTQRAGTPNERSILAREWSFRPATRRHQPMPVALARDTLPHRGPASLDLHAPACARRVPLAWTGQIEGRGVRVKANRALLDDVARALLVAPRAPGSPARSVMRPGGPHHSSCRPRLLFDAAPRRATPSKEPGCLLPHRNPYASGGWLLRARLDRGLVTPPPERHCSETRAPFLPALQRLLLTRKALEPARPTVSNGAKPRWNDRSQRPSRLLRPNQAESAAFVFLHGLEKVPTSILTPNEVSRTTPSYLIKVNFPFLPWMLTGPD
jgi:hypothetical protein